MAETSKTTTNQTAAEKTAAEAVKPAAEAVKETKAAAPKAAAEKKAPAKKAAVKKTAAKKPAAKKTARKTAAAVTSSVYIQFNDMSISSEGLVERVREIWKEKKNRISDLKDVKVYVNVAESKAYYVVNEDTFGAFDLN